MKLKEHLGCVRAPYDERDYLLRSFLRRKDLPEKVDYTEEMTPVRNQQNEGICVGMAGSAVKEWMEQKDYGMFVPLSPRFLYEEARAIDGLSHRSEGTTLVAAAKILVKKGICEERFWPYRAKDRGTPVIGVDDNALKYKIKSGWARATTEEEVKGYLDEYGPLLAGVAIYKNWEREEGGHIPNLSKREAMLAMFGWGSMGGHAIAICAYDNKTQEYKFKNSWGINEWGNKGFGYITYKCMRATVLDVIGMVDVEDPDHWDANGCVATLGGTNERISV